MSQIISNNSTPTFVNAKVSKFDVELREAFDSSIYFTGGRLKGEVVVEVKYPVKILRIDLKWVQVAKLGPTAKKTSHKELVFGKEKTASTQTLNVGNHRFPFDVPLPEHLLPTVKCKAQFVRYYCQACIVRKYKSSWSTGKKQFSVYQDNGAVTSLVPELQTPRECEELIKSLRLTYQLEKEGYFLGETPTIVGEIYNSGSSTANLKIGIDIVETTKMSGEMNLLVSKFRLRSKKSEEKFGPWSKELAIPSGAIESFSAEMNLKARPPTSHCRDIEITYQVALKLSIERKLSFRKPAQKVFYHDITIAKKPSGQPTMTRQTSKVSLGKSSLRRKTPPSHPRVGLLHSQGSSSAIDFQRTPPPPYGKLVF